MTAPTYQSYLVAGELDFEGGTPLTTLNSREEARNWAKNHEANHGGRYDSYAIWGLNTGEEAKLLERR